MGRFKFRLQSVLDHTGRQKQKAAADFAAAAHELAKRRTELATHQTVLASLKTAVPGTQCGLKVARLRELQACRDRVTRQIRGAEQRVQKQTRLADRKRGRLVEAQREEKKYQLLRERHRDQWQTATRRNEQREVDEIAGRRAASSRPSHRA
jgi:flagellar export protein FliJ